MLPTKDDFAPGERTWPAWGDRLNTSEPMMKPIASVPRNGDVVMVYCPGETPEHVAASWQSAKLDSGETAWEGLMFAEPMLFDVCPDGPQNATHWYRPPTAQTMIAEKLDAEAFQRDWEDSFEDHSHRDRVLKPKTAGFTDAQLEILRERGLDPVGIQYVVDGRKPLPVITDFRPNKNDAYVVWPNGEIGLRRWS